MQAVEHVVVTGMGVCTSVGAGVQAFTAALRNPSVDSAGGFLLKDFDFLHALNALGLPEHALTRAKQAARRAPLSLQLSMLTAMEAWHRSGLFGDSFYNPEDVGLVIAGQNLNLGYAYALAESYRSRLDFVPASHALHFMDTDQVGAVSETLGIRGEGFTVGGASASGNVGLLQGMRQITSGRAKACMVVGAMTDLSPLELGSMLNSGAMASDGVCRPFDRNRHGFVYGQGSASLLLEGEAGARQRGRPALGRLRGGAQCLDANRSSDPGRAGEMRVMRMAMADAAVEPADIDYINTHGTGSVIGDAVEYDAMRELFGERFPRIWLNSTKAITGHCLTAAGVIEAAAVLVQMNEGFLHATVGLKDPLGEEGRFVGASSKQVDCRVALSNAFGFGGINTSLVVEHP